MPKSLCTYLGPSTRIRIFLNPQLFLSEYGLLPHASVRQIWQRIRIFCYVRTRKLLNPGKKSCRFKNIRMRMNGALIEEIVIRTGKHQRNKQRRQDLCWKVHDRAQSFVLRSYTMHDFRNQNVSIGWVTSQ